MVGKYVKVKKNSFLFYGDKLKGYFLGSNKDIGGPVVEEKEFGFMKILYVDDLEDNKMAPIYVHQNCLEVIATEE